jgi:hypothetical protein
MSVQTDVIVIDETRLTAWAELSPQDAFEDLLTMLQAPDGSIAPENYEAYQKLMIVYEGWNRVWQESQELQRQNVGLLAALESVKADRDMLASDLKWRVSDAKQVGAKTAEKDIVKALAKQHKISEEAAGYLLQFITGQGDHAVNAYVQRILTEALGDAGQEIQELVDRDNLDMEMVDDDDD